MWVCEFVKKRQKKEEGKKQRPEQTEQKSKKKKIRIKQKRQPICYEWGVKAFCYGRNAFIKIVMKYLLFLFILYY